jgi:Peptidase family M23
MKHFLRLITTLVIFAALAPHLSAQNTCTNTPDYFPPITSGDGQRFPIAIGPLVWHLLGSGIYPVQGSDGRTHLAFALQFSNAWSVPATIQSVEVVDPANKNAPSGTNRVVSIKDEDVTGLVKLSTLPPAEDKSSYTSRLAGGQTGVMFFDVTYASPSEVPCAIAFRVHTLQPDVKPFPESMLVSPPLKVSQQQAMVIAPPFKGDGWMNGNGCCLEIGPHRFVTNATNGTLQPSEQFAIDWIKVDAHGMAFRTDGKTSEDWLDYGVELLAVADGTVVEVVRDLPDVPPGAQPPGLSLDNIPGNRVILDLGNSHYAVYCHLAPHSASVHVGDHVKTGQKLGLLGNSGNTTGPHLHFQISNRPSALDTTALPFVFATMRLESRTSANLEDIDADSIKGKPLPLDPGVAKPLAQAMPLSRDVVAFP